MRREGLATTACLTGMMRLDPKGSPSLYKVIASAPVESVIGLRQMQADVTNLIVALAWWGRPRGGWVLPWKIHPALLPSFLPSGNQVIFLLWRALNFIDGFIDGKKLFVLVGVFTLLPYASR